MLSNTPTAINAANRLKGLFNDDYDKALRAVNEIRIKNSKPYQYAEQTENMRPLAQAMKDAGLIVNTEMETTQFRHGWGAAKEGFLRTFDGREGVVGNPRVSPDAPVLKVNQPDYYGRNVVNEYVPMEGGSFIPYGNKFWEISSEGANYNLGEEALFRLGAIGGDVIGNGTRAALIWNSSPPEIASRVGQKLVLSGKQEGFPTAEAKYNKATGHVTRLPGSREGAAMAALGGMAAVEALNVGSGNYNPFNPQEGFRTAGFSAVSADPDGDRRKPTNLLSEVAQRHILGKKGNLLPWEQFRLERPDVSYEQYEKYNDWQYGRDDSDLLNKLTAGFVKFTGDGLSGMPELRMVGTTVNPIGVAAAVGAGLGVRQLNKVLGGRSLGRYQELNDLAKARQLTEPEVAEFLGIDATNAHARMVNRDGSGIRREFYSRNQPAQVPLP